MAEPTRSSVNGEAPEAFHTDNPPLTDGPLVGVVSHPPDPPLEVDHHHNTVHVVYLHLTNASNAHTSICVHVV
jgi:hypothetical protein